METNAPKVEVSPSGSVRVACNNNKKARSILDRAKKQEEKEKKEKKQRKFGKFLFVDIEDDSKEEVDAILAAVNKRKRPAVVDRDADQDIKLCPGERPFLWVGGGNDLVLNALGIGLTRRGDNTANLQLPDGWTMYRRQEWMGTTMWANVIKNEKGVVVCELVERMFPADVVVL
jgi:hypothetical protein